MKFRILMGLVFLFFSGDVLAQTGKKRMPAVTANAFATRNINLVYSDDYGNANIQTLIGTLAAIESQLTLNQVNLNESNTVRIIYNRPVAELFWINELLQANHSDSASIAELMGFIEGAYINENLTPIKNWAQKIGTVRSKNLKYIQIRPFSVEYNREFMNVADDETYFLQLMAVIKYCGKTAKIKSNDFGFQLSMEAIDAVFEYKKLLDESYNTAEEDEDETVSKPIEASFDLERTFFEIRDSIVKIGGIIRANSTNSYWDIIEKHIRKKTSFYTYEPIPTPIFYEEHLKLMESFYSEKTALQFWIIDGGSDFYDTIAEKGIDRVHTLTFERINSAFDNPMPLEKWKLYFSNDSAIFDSKYFNQIILSPDSFTDVIEFYDASDDIIVADSTGTLGEEWNNENYDGYKYRNRTIFGVGPTYLRTYSKLGSLNSMLDVKGLPHVAFNHSAGFEIWLISGESRSTYSFGASNALIKLNNPANYTNWVFAMNFTTDLVQKKTVRFGIGQDFVFAGHNVRVLESSNPGNIHIGDPESVDHVKNNQISYGLDLDLLLKFGGVIVHALGGYQYDFGDYRWQRNEKYINSTEQFSGSGFFFNVGLGVTLNN